VSTTVSDPVDALVLDLLVAVSAAGAAYLRSRR
jgi:hypothetical protein